MVLKLLKLWSDRPITKTDSAHFWQNKSLWKHSLVIICQVQVFFEGDSYKWEAIESKISTEQLGTS